MGLDEDGGLTLYSLDLLPVLREERQEPGPAADATPQPQDPQRLIQQHYPLKHFAFPLPFRDRV